MPQEHARPVPPTSRSGSPAIDGSGAAAHRRRLGPLGERASRFDADDAALIATADPNGRGPVFRLPLDGGAPEQLTARRLHLHARARRPRERRPRRAALVVGRAAASRAHRAPTASSRRSRRPAPAPEAPGTITEVETTAEDGARVRGWLLLPEGASDAAPAPLLLWIHGGPLSSWNAWSWRWAPLLAVARGYAVLLPDPALSTGYGLEFIARGLEQLGRQALHRPALDHRCRRSRAATSTRPAPRRWAGRSGATWRTGSRATPTASAPSSPTRASGRSTSSAARPTARSTGSASSRRRR